MTRARARLVLEDGSCFDGVACGADGVTSGEVVFNTSMTGYQEVLTDPSYAGQIVTMTCPEIGNYGTTLFDAESPPPVDRRLHRARVLADRPSNWRASATLEEYLRAHDIVALAGIDTRALTRRLRSGGVVRGAIGTGDVGVDELVARARRTPPMAGRDLVTEVTCAEPFDFGASPPPRSPTSPASSPTAASCCPAAAMAAPAERRRTPPLVAAYDFGMKWNILRRLTACGCSVRVFPAATPAARGAGRAPGRRLPQQRSRRPRRALPRSWTTCARSSTPGCRLFGICLGHQLLALALGGKTFKLKFGHRGGNHPVKNRETGASRSRRRTTGSPSRPARCPAASW